MLDTLEQPTTKPRQNMPPPRPRGPLTKRNYPWPEVRNDYATGLHTYATLAKKYAIPEPTIASRSNREKWVENRLKVNGVSVQRVVQKMENRIQSALAPKAQALVERSIKETEEWLDGIALHRAKVERMDSKELNDTVNAWRNAIAVGRTAHGLDSEGSKAAFQVNIGHLNNAEVIDCEVVESNVDPQ